MRDIKFRVWDKETKHIHIFGDDIHDAITSEGKTNKIYYYNLQNGCDSLDEDSDYVLMQYTGLKDKNGKEIFEGDIVYFNYREPQRHEIIFEDGSFWLKDKDSQCTPIHEVKEICFGASNFYLEVIGNVWEDSDLLNDN